MKLTLQQLEAHLWGAANILREADIQAGASTITDPAVRSRATRASSRPRGQQRPLQ